MGTLDIELAIREGRRSFETGILADANRNILYVDEINLLDDHAVDILLDSAAMGINTVGARRNLLFPTIVINDDSSLVYDARLELLLKNGLVLVLSF